MKKFVLTALITMITALGANAQIVSSDAVKSAVAAQLQANYSKKIDADVEVKIVATPFAQLQLPDGKITYKIAQGEDRIIPRDIKRIDVFVNNSYVKTLNLPTQTAVYKDVLGYISILGGFLCTIIAYIMPGFMYVKSSELNFTKTKNNTNSIEAAR